MAEPLIPPHGGYEGLKAYQMAVVVHDATFVFCNRYIDRKSRTIDQMVQAARSGSKTSRKVVLRRELPRKLSLN